MFYKYTKFSLRYIRNRVFNVYENWAWKAVLGRSCQNKFKYNNFHLQPHVSNCNEVEARAHNYENKGSLWTYFKNSFAWLTGMKKLIFGYYNFFRSSYFSIHEILKMDQKMTGAKKVIGSENQCFHSSWPHNFFKNQPCKCYFNCSMMILIRFCSGKLAACVNIIPGITSVYEWEGKVNRTEISSISLILTWGDA